jgi:undecaprenyl-diphosphatase
MDRWVVTTGLYGPDGAIAPCPSRLRLGPGPASHYRAGVLVEVVVVGGIGAIVLAASVLGARHPEIHPVERRVFQAVNGLPGWLYGVLWLPMQLGNLVVGTLAGLGIAAVAQDWRLAVAVVAAAALKLVAERWLRRRLVGFADVRQRPGTSEPGAILRGSDVPPSGPSFPSGHVILVAAVGAVVMTDLPGLWSGLPMVLAMIVAIGRIYVGAHNPLDTTAGLGMGMVVGALLTIPLG